LALSFHTEAKQTAQLHAKMQATALETVRAMETAMVTATSQTAQVIVQTEQLNSSRQELAAEHAEDKIIFSFSFY